eukprot:15359217-Ditylum_brightwellii.AAC.1
MTIPNGSNMHTSETLNLQLSKLPPKARKGQRLKNVAVVELCDAGCRVTFDQTSVVVNKDDKTLVSGWRDNTTRLWRIPIVDKEAPAPEHTPMPSIKCTTQEEYGNAVVQLQLIKFYHITVFSPVEKVLIKVATRKYLRGWPGFTQAAIRKHIDVEEATVKGHLSQARQGVRSTQVEEPECEQC